MKLHVWLASLLWSKRLIEQKLSSIQVEAAWRHSFCEYKILVEKAMNHEFEYEYSNNVNSPKDDNSFLTSFRINFFVFIKLILKTNLIVCYILIDQFQHSILEEFRTFLLFKFHFIHFLEKVRNKVNKLTQPSLIIFNQRFFKLLYGESEASVFFIFN